MTDIQITLNDDSFFLLKPLNAIKPSISNCRTIQSTQNSEPAGITITDLFSQETILHLQYMNKFEDVKKQLKKYLSYEDRWDGYKANRFSKEQVMFFEILVEQIASLHNNLNIEEISSTPSSDGAINLELTISNKEIQIKKYFNDKFVEYYSYDGKTSKTENYPADSNFLVAKLLGLSYKGNM
ncbi:MAG: hypothetical protein ACKVPJ_00860 [Chitinophagales bacterium]